MKLDVPLFRQDQDSVDCGPICLKMIFAYYGHDVALSDITSQLTYFTEGTSLPQLGSCALKQGFHAEIVTLNPFLFSRDMIGQTDRDQIITHLQERSDLLKLDQHRDVTRHFIEFVRDGGTLRLKIPDVTVMATEIEHSRPFISLLTTRFLHGLAGFNFHMNVVTGLNSDTVFINDPAAGIRGGQHALAVDAFIYGIHASAYGDPDNAALLLITPQA